MRGMAYLWITGYSAKIALCWLCLSNFNSFSRLTYASAPFESFARVVEDRFPVALGGVIRTGRSVRNGSCRWLSVIAVTSREDHICLGKEWLIMATGKVKW